MICSIDDCNRKYHAMRLCKNHYNQKWRKDNPERNRGYRKLWEKNHPEEYKKRNYKHQKHWARNNPEKVREKTIKWQKKNPEKILKNRIHYLKKLGSEFNMNSMEYKLALMIWSKSVKKRDGYKCQDCCSTENLHSHHILEKRYHPKLSLNINNGITLCHDCHWKTHKYLS